MSSPAPASVSASAAVAPPTGHGWARLWETAGFRRLVAAFSLARLPTGLVALTIALATFHRTGSLAVAGWSDACYAVAMAVGLPAAGRAVDRHGVRPVLVTTGFLYVVSLVAFASVSIGWLAAPAWSLLPLAAAAGGTVPAVAPVVRAAWTDTVAPQDQPAVNALESALSHGFYVVGPVVVAVSTWLGQAAYALLAAAVLNAAGVLLLLRCAAAVSLPRRATRASWTAVFRQPGATRALGATFGWALTLEGLEYAVIGRTAAEHRASLAGVLLAGTALGALAASAVVGGRRAAWWSRARTATWMLAWAVALLPLAVAAQLRAPLWLIGVLAVLGRLPSVGALTGLLAATTDAAAAGLRTETFAWRMTANLAGFGLGTSVCGVVAEWLGAGWVAAFGIVCAVAVAGLLRRRAPAPPHR